MNNHFMIDIETSGTNKDRDEILEVGVVEIQFIDDFWSPTGRVFHMALHYPGSPSDSFAVEHLSELYKKCNQLPKSENYEKLSKDLRAFLETSSPDSGPALFIGLNASGFDLDFLFKKKVLTPSFYVETESGQEMRGDAHYRVYEQTGAINILRNIFQLSKEDLLKRIGEIDYPEICLPRGKDHDAIYDSYRQINQINGLIALGRSFESKELLQEIANLRETVSKLSKVTSFYASPSSWTHFDMYRSSNGQSSIIFDKSILFDNRKKSVSSGGKMAREVCEELKIPYIKLEAPDK